MANVRGESCTLYVNTGSISVPVYTALGSEESLTLNRTGDNIDLSDKSSNWDLATGGKKSWEISANGIWVETDAAWNALETAFETDAREILVKVKTLSSNMYTGNAVIGSLNITSAKHDVVRVDISLKGDGALTEATAS
jgi:predicted secreted protein